MKGNTKNKMLRINIAMIAHITHSRNPIGWKQR